MSEQDKRCGTCKWWEQCSDNFGDCVFEIPVVPDSYLRASFDEMHESRGTSCPCWEAKE